MKTENNAEGQFPHKSQKEINTTLVLKMFGILPVLILNHNIPKTLCIIISKNNLAYGVLFLGVNLISLSIHYK